MCENCEKKDAQIAALQAENIRLRNKVLAMEAGILAKNMQRNRVRVNELFRQHPVPAGKGCIWMDSLWDTKLGEKK